jgi:hypothetical protein
METMEKRESVIHILNTFLVNPINIYIARETEKYIICYEPKRYRIHNLVYKIEKDLVKGIQFKIQFKKENKIKLDTNIDINVRTDFRETIKEDDPQWYIKAKNITVRIVKTRYNEFSSLYSMIYQFYYRKTGAGGVDRLEFSIPECPVISNANTVKNVCYKLIGKQVSGSSTHELHTYLLIAPLRGQYTIGNHIRISNLNQNGHRNMHVYPVTITL